MLAHLTRHVLRDKARHTPGEHEPGGQRLVTRSSLHTTRRRESVRIEHRYKLRLPGGVHEVRPEPPGGRGLTVRRSGDERARQRQARFRRQAVFKVHWLSVADAADNLRPSVRRCVSRGLTKDHFGLDCRSVTTGSENALVTAMVVWFVCCNLRPTQVRGRFPRSGAGL